MAALNKVDHRNTVERKTL